MALYITSNHKQTLYSEAETAYPEECCGLLIGKKTGPNKTILEIWTASNSWTSETADKNKTTQNHTKKSRYSIAPEFMLKAQKQSRERNLTILGIYHSHPDNPANPSEYDRQNAWPQYSYIIISVNKGKATDLKNWTLDDTSNFQPEKITINQNP